MTVGADAGKSIPVDVINNVTGERYSMNLSLAYDGEFGCTAIRTINMESENAESDAWNPTIIIIIGICILLSVFGAVIFVRKKEWF